MESNGCPGEFRVHRGKWSIPVGKTARECTYCEWCVKNGCVVLEADFSVERDLSNCLCDCPSKDTHPTLQPYNCGKHEDLIGMQLMGRCRACHRPESTPSSAEKFCEACSALFGICEVCGVTPQGRYPMRPVTKMLSSENGRARRGGSSESDEDEYDCTC